MFRVSVLTARSKAAILLAFAAFGWGTNTIAGKLAVGEVSPMMLIFLRWGIVAVLLSLIYFKQMLVCWPVIKARLVWVMLMGGLGLSMFNALFYMAAHHTTALNLGIIQSMMPAMILLGSFLVWRTKVTRLQMFGLVFAFVGAILVVSKGSVIEVSKFTLNMGDLLMFLACIFYAGYAVGLRDRPDINGIVMMAYFSVAAFFMTIPLVLVEAFFFELQYPTTTGLQIIVYIAIVPSFLCQVFFMKGVDTIGPNSSGLYANLVPITSTFLAVVILGEALELYHLISLGFVFFGIYIFDIKARNQANSAG